MGRFVTDPSWDLFAGLCRARPLLLPPTTMPQLPLARAVGRDRGRSGPRAFWSSSGFFKSLFRELEPVDGGGGGGGEMSDWDREMVHCKRRAFWNSLLGLAYALVEGYVTCPLPDTWTLEPTDDDGGGGGDERRRLDLVVGRCTETVPMVPFLAVVVAKAVVCHPSDVWAGLARRVHRHMELISSDRPRARVLYGLLASGTPSSSRSTSC